MKSFISLLVVAANLVGIGASGADINAPLIVIATVKVQPGYESAFKEAARKILAPTAAEPGSISYQFNQSTQDPTEFSTIELWRSQQDIDLHMATPHMQRFFGEVGPMFAPGYPILKTYQKFEE